MTIKIFINYFYCRQIFAALSVCFISMELFINTNWSVNENTIGETVYKSCFIDEGIL